MTFLQSQSPTVSRSARQRLWNLETGTEQSDTSGKSRGPWLTACSAEKDAVS